jgi:hypothetical protein
MALSREEKTLVAEYVAAGLIAREVADRLLGGRVTKAEMSFFRSFARVAGRAIGTGLARAPGTAMGIAARGAGAARFIALRHPYVAAGAVIAVGIHERDKIADLLSQGYELVQTPVAVGDPGQFGAVRPGPIMATVPTKTIKRAVSKANRAVKHGMTLLKAGTKAQTGSKPGTLAKGAFKIATKAAGLANPKTPSKITKAKTKVNKLARKIRKWW